MMIGKSYELPHGSHRSLSAIAQLVSCNETILLHSREVIRSMTHDDAARVSLNHLVETNRYCLQALNMSISYRKIHLEYQADKVMAEQFISKREAHGTQR